MMRFVSFNVNGIRAHMHQVIAIIKQLKPDILGLQETKVHDDYFPIQDILKHGYYVYFYGKKKYKGVALLIRQKPLEIIKVFSKNSELFQQRAISAKILTSIGTLTIINIYFPQGDNKNKLEKFLFKKIFYQNLYKYIKSNYNNKMLLLIMGDMNVSPTDLDIGIGEKNKKRWILTGKCSFLPEEREWLYYLINWGLIDIYRNNNPKSNKYYSWFSYRSNRFIKNSGLRIDLILVTNPLIPLYKNSGIDYKIRAMQKPSDHAPIWVDFNI